MVDVAVLLALRLVAAAAVRPVVLLEVVEGLAHKLLPRVRLQVAVVLAPLREALAVVAVVGGLVQGPVASESLRRQ